MRKNNNIIEINGQRYNATTGALLEQPQANAAKPKPPIPLKTTASHAIKSSTRDVRNVVTRRTAGRHAPAHKPAPSDTLMRQAVKKPAPGSNRRIKAQGHADTPIKRPLDSVMVKASAKRLDEKRLRHASRVAKSHLISHFSAPIINNDLAAFKPPAKPGKTPPISSIKVTDSALARARRSAKLGKHPQTTAELLERALRQADSHKQPALPRRKHTKAKRNAGIGATVVLSVLLLGVVVAQNMPNVRLQMASASAGFNASLPDYHPAGYSLGQLNYSSGIVAAQFHSNSDGRRYTITQKSSLWNSATLRDTFVAPADAHYQTVEASGRTIYIYNGHNATWVNGGAWYIIQSNDSLNDQQLVKLAASL